MEQIENLTEKRKEFNLLKRDVAQLRNKLNALHREKEEAFRELRSLRDKIKNRTERIKVLKKERDELTKEVKSLKVVRDQLNLAVKEKATQRKEVDKKKEEAVGSFGYKENPAQIRSLIRRLEEQIETEVMPFSKELQINKKIKELKSKCKELEKLGDIWKEVNTVTADFAENRRKAQESHHKVQETAQESQEKHEKINQAYEELKELRTKEQPLAEKALQLRVQFEQAKKELEESLGKVNELAKLFQEEEEKSFKTKVREKTAEVREKIKKGKKLSTEDILAFQALDENN